MSLPVPEQPSRNRSASTGDSGLPQHEHKRPRLSESQDASPPSLTISTANGNQPSMLQQPAHSSDSDHTISAAVTPPHSPLPNIQQPDATSPTSKVTINTRPISSLTSTADAQSEAVDGAAMEPQHSESTHQPSPCPPSSERHDNYPDTISISSDEQGSPVIQVAALEDLDQDPADTRWEPMSDPASLRRLPIRSGHVQRTFPFNDPSLTVENYSIIASISKAFIDGADGDGEIFQKIKTWLVDFVQNAEGLDHDFFEEDHEFWTKFPSLCSGILKRRVGPPRGLEVGEIVDFFVAYAHITLLVIEADVDKLRTYSETTDSKAIVGPRCTNYLSQLHWMITPEGVPLYEQLQRIFEYNPTQVTGLIIDEILNNQKTNLIKRLVALFQAMADLIPNRPAFFELGLMVASQAGSFAKCLAERVAAVSTEPLDTNDEFLALLSTSSGFLRSIDALLDRAITKQQPWMNIETCEKLFKNAPYFVTPLTTAFPQVAAGLVLAANIQPSDFGSEELASLAPIAWKFSTLLKLIKKGRMEVRVSCVSTMAGDLVDLYNEHIRSAYSESEHVIVQFMIQLLRNNNIIRYMIGVDSHPQIIDRCSNIIGFLCVSHSYRNDDTDTIWQTVLESQDPRTVVAVLGVFQHNLDNLDVDLLCYIARKVLDLPYGRFDMHTLDFAVRLINILAMKVARTLVGTENEMEIDECTLRLLLKMLREGNTPEQICSEMGARARTQVCSMLNTKVKLMKGKLRLGTDRDLMHPMFVELCEDVRTHSKFASGSALSLGTILLHAELEECLRIVQDHGVTATFVDDITHASRLSTEANLQETTWHAFDCRFKLMIALVYQASHTITEPLIDSLWSNMLALPEFDRRLRQMAWAELANIFESCTLRNEMLDIVTQKYLPTLPPALYDESVLHFAKLSVKYEMRHTPMDLIKPANTISLPGIDRIWDFMLKVPSNTVELAASQFIIEQYLDGELMTRRDNDSIEQTHLALIDTTVQQVMDAANHLKTVTDAEMTDDSPARTDMVSEKIEVHAMTFHRCLLFLHNFLDNIKARPRYAPAVDDGLKKTLSTLDKKGPIFEVTLQILGHRSLTSTQLKWILGFENTGAEVWQFLSDITGWSQFAIINGGRKIALRDEQQNLRELGIRNGSFMINKIQGSPENTPARAVRAASPVDDKVMHHFNEFYSLLDLDNHYAREVFDFLRMFSSQAEVVQKLKSMTFSPEQLLPVEKPFKLMYYARTLHSCVEDESFSSDPNTGFLVYSVRTILSILPNLHNLKADLETGIQVAQGLVETLILAFRARVSNEISASYVIDGSRFCQTILAQWTRALEVTRSDGPASSFSTLVRTPFEALVEGLLHDERLWSMLPPEDFRDCLQQSLLSHPTREVRQAALDVIHGLTGVLSSKFTNKSNESRTPRGRFNNTVIDAFLKRLWTVLLALVPDADTHSATCEEAFDAVLSVLRQYRQKISEDDLRSYIKTWKSHLLAHKHSHSVGLAPHDYFISSIGRLLISATKSVQPRELLGSSKAFIHDLFERFLFPPLVDTSSFDTSDGSDPAQQHDPILDMSTRWVLYELILTLGHDKDHLDAICDELSSDLVPKNLYFQPSLNNDRQALRSEAGYSGLRNLSNTCYLNSLISQLFMNVEFRELVMNVNIIDQSKQKLVFELAKVFAHMQMSYEEAVTPEAAINAITLWDGEQIDVTVQMDVDEFFNLLFDRLESQIVDPKVCSTFKSIYGGQLVQQIKSKECEHVSERLEPFATVQVEIKGKATLEESLRAYVEGEVLQGENKYSCTGCGKHVDAVKRACLKTIPDHLIFNLKRFDYDIMTGMRCKVNDEFGFPEAIDMAPYTLEALTNTESQVKHDIFELVGIIIHSGTAESGHYYSYIRQRPSATSRDRSWIQFNDHDVSHFDPASIKDCCFGGIDFGAIQCPKFYNGYMLFYQRSSSIRKFEHKYLDGNLNNSVQVALPAEQEAFIAQVNELYLRSYVAQDPVHAKLIRCLLQQTQTSDELACSQRHSSTKTKLLRVALDYLNSVSGRWKDLPEVEETLSILQSFASKCLDCAQQIIDWLTVDENLVNNVVRSCYQLVRKGFSILAATCWRKWYESVNETRQLEEPRDDKPGKEKYATSLAKFLTVMASGWELLQRHARSWDPYINLVSFILNRGAYEARAVIEAGFLESALELVHVHIPSMPVTKRLKTKYQTYLTFRERNRVFPHATLIQFLADLVESVDLVTPVTNFEDRVVFEDRVGPSMSEVALLNLNQPPPLFWLKKTVIGRYNPPAVNAIVARLCNAGQFDGMVSRVLKDGLADRNLQNAISFLQPTVTFVSNCSDREIITDMVNEALELMETTQGQYGKDFITFLQDLLAVRNAEASIGLGGLKFALMKYIAHWAPVLLMAPNDIHADIRGDALELVNEILFQEMDNARRTDARKYRLSVEACKSLAEACAHYARNTFIDARATSIQPGQATQVNQVVQHCLGFFGDTASDEDLTAQITSVMEEFQARSEGVVETITEADWNASSDLEAMSEVENLSDTSN